MCSYAYGIKKEYFQSPLLVRPFNTIAIARLASPTMGCISSATADETCVSLEALLQPAALDSLESWPEEHRSAWMAWTQRYWQRVRTEARPVQERRSEMAATNPKFVLRNWMAKEGYEAADRGDYSIVRELHAVLTRPYEEQSDEITAKYAQVTPVWARGRMGLESMS